MNNELIVLVGLSGSGKSELARKLSDELGYIIISSDQQREREYGDESIQGNNSKLFDGIHAGIVDKLMSGRSVIFDATNLNPKHRIALLQKVRKTGCKKRAIVVATPVKKCLENNLGRNRVVPEFVIKNQRKAFTFPLLGEGFDFVEVIFPFDIPESYELMAMYESMKGFNQDNPHHAKDLFGHVVDVIKGVGQYDLIVHLAAVFHDVGKLFTKQFKNARGEETDIAHYYSHENVSSYEAMFYMKNLGVESLIPDVCGLVQNHMRMHGTLSDKAKEKLIRLLGRNNFESLVKLHIADTEGKD